MPTEYKASGIRVNSLLDKSTSVKLVRVDKLVGKLPIVRCVFRK